MKASHALYRERRRFDGLDGVRAIAIIAVIWHHAPHPIILPMMTRGFFGVDLFFVLSGFLISTLLIREKARFGRISLKDFWMRRALRLMPAYYALLFSLLVVYSVFKPGDPDTAALQSGFPAYALYLSNWLHPGAPNLDPTWSLATEEQFYLVWPTVEAFAAPAVLAGAWAALFVVNQLINFGVLDPAIAALFGIAGNEYPEILQTTFTPILLGVGLAHLLHREKSFLRIMTLAGFRFAPAIYALALLLLLNIPAADISGPLRLFFHVAATLFIASLIARPDSAVTRVLNSKPVAFVGAVSYGMYLYHLWCLHAARVFAAKLGLPEFPIVFLVGATLTVVVAAASYLIFEKRFLELRRKFRKSERASPAPVAASQAP